MKIFNRRKNKAFRSSLRSESDPIENKFWQEIRGKQLGYKFRRQHGVGNFIVDFYCPEIRLIVEIDGESHTVDRIVLKDKLRQTYLEGLGFVVVRYSTQEIGKNLEGVLRNLKAVCDKLSGETRVEWE